MPPRLLALLVLVPLPLAEAAPLVDPGDPVLRQDLAVLGAFAGFPGSLDAWPLSGAHLDEASAAGGEPLPAYVLVARSRVLASRPVPGRWRLEASGSWTNRRALVYGFSGGARRDLDLWIGAESARGPLAGRIRLGYREEAGRDELVLDGTAVSLALGNWTIYGGLPERWYGPGGDAGLVLGRNARPLPGVGIFRSVPRRSRPGWLRWMGPWRLDGFVGVLNGPRADFRNPLLLNLHLGMEPWPRLHLTFTRGIMICGEGRPCGFETWARALFAVFDLDNTSDPGNDPSNQNASISLSYTFLRGENAVTPYVEWFFEDEIQDVSVVAGLRLLAGAGSGTWRFQLEHSDTYADRIMGALPFYFDPNPSKTYQHFIYKDGYFHRGESLGHPLGGDGRLTTLEGGWVGKDGRWLTARMRRADVRINPGDVLAEPVLRGVFAAETEAGLVLGTHRVGASLRFLDRDPWGGGASWQGELRARLRWDVGG